MRSKVVAAGMATAAGIAAVICSGCRAEALERVLAARRKWTRFPPRATGYSSFKLWLQVRRAEPGHRRGPGCGARRWRTADEPAAGRIVDVTEGSRPEDAVNVTEGERAIGKGISNYSRPSCGR